MSCPSNTTASLFMHRDFFVLCILNIPFEFIFLSISRYKRIRKYDLRRSIYTICPVLLTYPKCSLYVIYLSKHVSLQSIQFSIRQKMICKKNLNFQIQNNAYQRGFDLFNWSVSSGDVALVWNNKCMAFKVNCFVFTYLRSFGSGMHQTVPNTCKYTSIFLTY